MRVLLYDQGKQYTAMRLKSRGSSSTQCDLYVAGKVHRALRFTGV